MPGGMVKAKEYDWKDSNMALFGSDTDKKVKKESAETEKAWKNAGTKLGTQVWRIVKFKVTHWDKEQYGSFYNGDSYIILNTYKDAGEDEIKYDVHFWIGKYSTADEYGTAAYKTVELDTLLDDKPVQHREVQGHESQLFTKYFETLTILKGGAETGFNRVLPTEYVTRLMHVEKVSKKKIKMVEVSAKRDKVSADLDDVFIIDNGLILYQVNGPECTHDEKYKANSEVKKINSSRMGKCKIQVVDLSSSGEDHPALKLLSPGESKTEKEPEPEAYAEMFVVSDEDGSMDMDPVEWGRDGLNSKDVFIVNSSTHVFCWVGKEASVDERKNAMTYAHNYLSTYPRPWLPISVIAEGKETASFDEAFVNPNFA